MKWHIFQIFTNVIHIQSDAVITRSNIVKYLIYNHRNRGRTSMWKLARYDCTALDISPMLSHALVSEINGMLPSHLTEFWQLLWALWNTVISIGKIELKASYVSKRREYFISAAHSLIAIIQQLINLVIPAYPESVITLTSLWWYIMLRCYNNTQKNEICNRSQGPLSYHRLISYVKLVNILAHSSAL